MFEFHNVVVNFNEEPETKYLIEELSQSTYGQIFQLTYEIIVYV